MHYLISANFYNDKGEADWKVVKKGHYQSEEEAFEDAWDFFLTPEARIENGSQTPNQFKLTDENGKEEVFNAPRHYAKIKPLA